MPGEEAQHGPEQAYQPRLDADHRDDPPARRPKGPQDRDLPSARRHGVVDAHQDADGPGFACSNSPARAATPAGGDVAPRRWYFRFSEFGSFSGSMPAFSSASRI